MISTIFPSLTPEEQTALALQTLFDCGGPAQNVARDVYANLVPMKDISFMQAQTQLGNRGILKPTEYNWRTDAFNYVVCDHLLIECMTYLYEHEAELAISVLQSASRLAPLPHQKVMWEFISTGYQQLAPRNTMSRSLAAHERMLTPYLSDDRYAPVFMTLDESQMLKLYNFYFEQLFTDINIVDTTFARSLLKSYQEHEKATLLTPAITYIDLYDYLTKGSMPDNLIAKDCHHRILAAIHELYNDNAAKAYEHFAKALTMKNKGIIPTISSLPYFPYSILNYFFIIAAYKQGTVEARQKAYYIAHKVRDSEATDVASLLYDVLFDNETDNNIAEAIAQLLPHADNVDQALLHIIATYVGLNPDIAPNVNTEWITLKLENSRTVPLTGDDADMAEKAFGGKPLLASIYHKQTWERVLDELMGNADDMPAPNAKPQARIAYYMPYITAPYAEPKMQTILKSGAWSAGKAVSFYTFEDGDIDCMDDIDHRIVYASRFSGSYGHYELDAVLPNLVGTDRLYVGTRAPYTPVEIIEDTPYITLLRDNNGFSISSNVPLEQVDDNVVITHRGANSINYLMLNETQKIYYKRLLSLKHFPADAEDRLREFLSQIGGKIEVNSDLIEGGSTLPITEGSAMLIMQMRPQGKEDYVIHVFVRPLENGHIRCQPGQGNAIIVDSNADGQRTRVERDLAREQDNYLHFINGCRLAQGTDDDEESLTDSPGCGGTASASDTAITDTMTLDVARLLPIIDYAQRNTDRISCEWPEGQQVRITRRPASATWTAAIRKNDNGWFELEGSVEVDQDRVLTMSQLLDLVGQSRNRYIKISDGEFLQLSDKLHKQLLSLNAIAGRSHGRIQMSPFSAAVLGTDIMDGELKLTEDDELRAIRKRILDSSTYNPYIPRKLNATLRPYQRDGYQWMSRLNYWGAGALLADDMGLGKTIQTIACLLAKAKQGPALVVAPASVAPNWKTEMERFAPSLNVLMLNFAPSRRQMVKDAKAGDVVVTTYGLLLSVKEYVTEKHWTTICLDEAHIIKNRGAKTSAVAMQLKGDNRIMLTGTPVQNHLSELWSLFQFVNPGLLGSFDDFSRRFIAPIEQYGDKDVQHALDKLVKPFMLRRTKDRVAKELPEKEEIYQHVTLTKDEQTIYELLRQKAEAMLLAEAQAGRGGKVSMTTLAEITRLRQCSCDIRLVEEGRRLTGDTAVGGVEMVMDNVAKGAPRRSTKAARGKAKAKENTTDSASTFEGSKIMALVELLQTVLDGFTVTHDSDGRKTTQGGVLVFSQFTSYLALVRRALDSAGIAYLYMDGSVDIKTRQRLVNDFQAGACPVFLISLKAGGLGLNLTRANYVVHMDPWWNPAIEAQATDRAHRIGQQQSVTVYHLIAEGTIEEKIQRLHEKKQELVRNILESTDSSHTLTGEELLNMVRG